MKNCHECQWYDSGNCLACQIPVPPSGEPCDKFKLRGEIKDYADVNEKHSHSIRHIVVGTEDNHALIILRDGGGICASSPEDADKQLNDYEALKKGFKDAVPKLP